MFPVQGSMSALAIYRSPRSGTANFRMGYERETRVPYSRYDAGILTSIDTVSRNVCLKKITH